MPSVTRRRRTARPARRQDARRRMFEAVERLLAEGRCYTDLSVEAIVAEAGMSRATFYIYFEDKGDLLRGLTEELTDGFIDSAGVLLKAPPGAPKPVLRDAFSAISEAYMPHCVLMAALADSATYDAVVREDFLQMLERLADALADHIRRGQAEGAIDERLDADRTALCVAWMIERGLQQLVAPASPDQAERLLGAVADIVWNTFHAGRSHAVQ